MDKRKRNQRGYFGEFGGRYAPETLMPALYELENAYNKFSKDKDFNNKLNGLLRDYCGRPTPLYYCERMSSKLKGAKIFLKREDLNHTGAHKINNALGQALLAWFMGKKRLVAETGAGQHGVATATAAALMGLKAVVYMGTVDMKRQLPNVIRMRMLGAEVVSVDSGGKTLKDAVNEALRDWTKTVRDTHYCMGSTVGPHPFPTIVRDFQSVIGNEARRQIIKSTGKLPDCVVACVGGGSNSLGIFNAFIRDRRVELVGVEAGGMGLKGSKHAVRLTPTKNSRKGILHGSYSYVLQDQNGQISDTYSISAGLDYSGVGPQHAHLYTSGRAEYVYATDKEALSAFKKLCKYEGIIPALEPSHALAYGFSRAASMPASKNILINLSGRGDKDIEQISESLGIEL